MNLYPVLIRPQLEYCLQVWSPYKQRDMNLLKGVQWCAMKLIPELRNLAYEDRLSELGLTTLKERRIRSDMIETYKMISGKEDINPSKFFRMRVDRDDLELAIGLTISKKRLQNR